MHNASTRHIGAAPWARASRVAVLAFGLTLARLACAQQEVALWPNGAPGFKHSRPESVEDRHETGRPDRYIGYVSNPTLTLYPAAAGGARPAPIVLVLPGGGFRYVCIDKEGIELAHRLNSLGIAAAVLKYRTVDPDAERNWDVLSPLLALGDAARAIRVLRHNAAAWNIDAAHLNVIGFSAGGTMAIQLTRDADDGKPGASDPVEAMSSRPNSVALIYSTLPDRKMPKVDKAVPYFIAHAADDTKAPVAVSIKLFQNVLEAGGAADLHIFSHGEHGFGVAPPAGSVQQWPDLYARWLRGFGGAL